LTLRRDYKTIRDTAERHEWVKEWNDNITNWNVGIWSHFNGLRAIYSKRQETVAQFLSPIWRIWGIGRETADKIARALRKAGWPKCKKKNSMADLLKITHFLPISKAL
jgi:hypothetical protein